MTFQIQNTPGGTHIGAGGEKAGEFVAGEERVLQWRLARDARIVRVRENGAEHFIGVAVLAENSHSFSGVLAVGRMGLVGPTLVVEIVE